MRFFPFENIIPLIQVPLFVFAFHVLVSIPPIDFYARWSWFDVPMHFFGGVSIAIAANVFLEMLRVRNLIGVFPWWLHTLFLLVFVGCAAAVWELLEFSVTHFIGIRVQGTLPDTMADVFFGLLGGVSVAVFLKIRREIARACRHCASFFNRRPL